MLTYSAQRELEKLEKSEFMNNCLYRLNSSVIEWFMKQGYFVIGNDIYNYSNDSIPNMKIIKKQIDDFYHAYRLVSDGGPLTSKRKEIMLESIYVIEKARDEIETIHPLMLNIGNSIEHQEMANTLRGVGLGLIFTVVLIPVSCILFYFAYKRYTLAKNFKLDAKSVALSLVSEY